MKCSSFPLHHSRIPLLLFLCFSRYGYSKGSGSTTTAKTQSDSTGQPVPNVTLNTNIKEVKENGTLPSTTPKAKSGATSSPPTTAPEAPPTDISGGSRALIVRALVMRSEAKRMVHEFDKLLDIIHESGRKDYHLGYLHFSTRAKLYGEVKGMVLMTRSILRKYNTLQMVQEGNNADVLRRVESAENTLRIVMKQYRRIDARLFSLLKKSRRQRTKAKARERALAKKRLKKTRTTIVKNRERNFRVEKSIGQDEHLQQKRCNCSHSKVVGQQDGFHDTPSYHSANLGAISEEKRGERTQTAHQRVDDWDIQRSQRQSAGPSDQMVEASQNQQYKPVRRDSFKGNREPQSNSPQFDEAYYNPSDDSQYNRYEGNPSENSRYKHDIYEDHPIDEDNHLAHYWGSKKVYSAGGKMAKKAKRKHPRFSVFKPYLGEDQGTTSQKKIVENWLKRLRGQSKEHQPKRRQHETEEYQEY